MNNLCFSFYVSGQRYYEYIPLCLYFIGKSHPQAFTVIYCKETLDDKFKLQLQQLTNQSFRISENEFGDCPNDVDLIKTLRFIMFPKEYEHYEYIYCGDIDLFITSPSLLPDHLLICEEHGVPYSNSDNIDCPINVRFTGLHFFKSKPYLKKMLPVIQKYSGIIKESGLPIEFYNEKQKRYDLQKALRVMVEESGLPMPNHSFFKYHGLHLGHSRCPGRWEMFFSTPNDEHIGYYKEFMGQKDTREYNWLYQAVSSDVQMEIDIMTSAWDE